MSVKFSNNAVTTLTDSPSIGATSFTVASASDFPTLASGDWTYVSLTSEVVKVTAISGTTFTCDATVNAHSSGESVELRMTAELLNDFAEDTEALPLAGGTMTGDVSLGDNVRAKFGAGDDLQIYHDGSNSYIKDDGTGDLKVLANKFIVRNVGDTTSNLEATPGGSIKLYNNGSVKLATTSTGIDVTGSVTCDGLTFGSNHRIQGTGGLFLGGSTATVFEVGAGSEKMRLTSTGLGIGTTSPSVGLQVGNSTSGQTQTVIFNSEGGGEIGLTVQSRTNRAKIRVKDNDTSAYIIAENSVAYFGQTSSASSNNLAIDSTGNVGIGTSSPRVALDVDGEVAIAYNATYGLRFYNDVENNWSSIGNNVTGSSSANLAFKDASGEVMRLDGAGNVGIGTSSPTAKLHVEGDVRLLDNGSIQFGSSKYQTLTGQTGSNDLLYRTYQNHIFKTLTGASDNTDGSERMRIDSVGNVTPGADNTQDFGSPTKRWANIYTGDLHLSNEGSTNEVDGTSGNWTIQEGENDLYIINNKNGKKFKFSLQEIS